MIQTLFKDLLKEIIIWFKKLWFESKLKARLKMIEIQNEIEYEQELKKSFKPTLTEHKVDPKIQTGKSAKLGGALQLSAPWKKIKSK
ncbi:MAG TPA: hypothetical protein DCX54_09830 [Flavobacteriales bacterium]|nr:hypothetical protein [Flavobacteriales bacterium]